jgi:hypothetical protein
MRVKKMINWIRSIFNKNGEHWDLVEARYIPTNRSLYLEFRDGLSGYVEVDNFEGLEKASEEDLRSLEFSSGGLHIESLDWDYAEWGAYSLVRDRKER